METSTTPLQKPENMLTVDLFRRYGLNSTVLKKLVGFRLHNIKLVCSLVNEASFCFLNFELISAIIDCNVHAGESFMPHCICKS